MEAIVYAVRLSGAVDYVVLKNYILNAGLAHFAAQVGYLLNGQSAIIKNYHRLRLFELFADLLDLFRLYLDICGVCHGFTSLQNENPLPKTKDRSLLNKLATYLGRKLSLLYGRLLSSANI